MARRRARRRSPSIAQDVTERPGAGYTLRCRDSAGVVLRPVGQTLRGWQSRLASHQIGSETALQNANGKREENAPFSAGDLLPAWFGFGAGLDAAEARHGAGVLEHMVARWPFFGSIIDEVEFGLAVADMTIASWYAALAAPERQLQISLERQLLQTLLNSLYARKGVRVVATDVNSGIGGRG